MKSFGLSLVWGLIAQCAFADCPNKADADETLILDVGSPYTFIESHAINAGTVETIVDKNSDERLLIWLYVHPLLTGELFSHKTHETTGVVSKREYLQSPEPLNELDSVKEWQADFVVERVNEEPERRHVRVEYQKSRIERVGKCKYKVWEVMIHESGANSDQKWMKVLYSPDLKRVLRRGQSDTNTSIVYDPAFKVIRVKEQ